MILKQSFKTAIVGIKSHKSRSTLTILGIVIGIVAIIMVMALGKGAQNLIISQIQGMGSQVIAIVPGREPKGMMDAAQTLFSDSLKKRELDLLSQKSNVPHLSKIIPVIFGSASASYQNEIYHLTIFGTSENGQEIYDMKTSEGIFFSREDIAGYADVIIIGSKVKDELFGPYEDALGKIIKIKNRNFKVIGVLAKKGQSSLVNFDDIAMIPYTTAQQFVFGIKHFHRIVVQADSENNISSTVDDIKRTLRNAHNITDPEKDDFFIETQADLVSRVSMITDILTLFLVSIAAISLLVGGVGIMNIMLVSVTERTREIGLRKAVGATPKDILTQFLFEAILLTAIGGIIGIILGATSSFLLAAILSKVANLNWPYNFPVSASLLGLAVSALIGLIFGLYPARRAASLDPIEALRYE